MIAMMMVTLWRHEMIFLAQATPINETVNVINSLGLPVAFLVLTIGALRVMWKVMSQRDQDALNREIDRTKVEQARADRNEQELAALNIHIRDRIMPTLERATIILTRELERKDPP